MLTEHFSYYTDYTQEQTDLLIAFLNDTYDHRPYDTENPWPSVKPWAFFTLYNGDMIVGHQSVFRLKSSDNSLTVLGLGDLAIRKAHRGNGHAKRLIDSALSWCHGQAPVAILTNSRKMAPYFVSLGFTAQPSADQFARYKHNGIIVNDPTKLVKIIDLCHTQLPLTITTPVF